MKKLLKLEPADEPWFVWLRHPFDRDFMEWYKQFPGRQWVPEQKCWKFPLEMLGELRDEAWRRGYTIEEPTRTDFSIPDVSALGALYEYQRDHVAQALMAGGRWIFANDTGVGKTAEAIGFLAVTKPHRALIVCPALVRRHWLAELSKWWLDHPEVGLIEYGSKRKLSKPKREALERAHEAPIQIVSYHLSQEIPANSTWDVIVLDESHKLSSRETQWSRHLKNLLHSQDYSCSVLGLTATAIPNRAYQLWNQLDTIWPQRFGTGYQFLERYLEQDHNGYGIVWKGLRGDTGEELQQRLQVISSRTTKGEIAHLMPPFQVSVLSVSGGGRKGSDKVDVALEWLRDMVDGGEQWLCILTHHRDLAKAICAVIERRYLKKFALEHVDGEIPVPQRLERIEKLKGFSSGILVGTMESVGIGIDLTQFSQCLFAELHYRPEVMIQALGRFSRLSGAVPSSCSLVCVEGTNDELIVSSLQDKIADINALVKPGLAEGKLEEALGKSPQEVLDSLEELALNYKPQDPLLFWEDED